MSSEEQKASPIDEATYRYNSSLKQIKALNGLLSKKALNRVYNATMSFPLSEETPKFKDRMENELFMLTLTALAAKDQILVYLYENQDAIKKEINERMGSKKETEAIGVSEELQAGPS